METRRLIFLGAGGTSLDVLGFLRDAVWEDSSFHYECLGFLDDVPERHGSTIEGLTVLGPLSHAGQFPDAFFLNGLASPNNFRQLNELIAKAGISPQRFHSYLHPRAVVSPSSHLGVGTIVYPGVSILSSAYVGDLTTVLANAVINHHVRIGPYSALASNVSIAGRVSIASNCYLGSSCSILQGVTIGSKSLVGMGSIVLHDVAPGSVVAGNPARQIGSASQK
jgi:sugar O-acyltransferase (sialic acid O-acetyltransferase NeuD family)